MGCASRGTRHATARRRSGRKPEMTLLDPAALPLAASGTPSLLMILVGLVVVLVLLGAFWWGSRRVARRRRPTGGVRQPPGATREKAAQDSEAPDSGGNRQR
ncbi:DUF6479 family protein [Streptomyces sp. NPDC059071]|uniref:DUF6479 family protein n=2 Tax=unclassified Streptomyces TaxID=2593676 RepID=UPI0036AFB900